jgi:hypothetical protein
MHKATFPAKVRDLRQWPINRAKLLAQADLLLGIAPKVKARVSTGKVSIGPIVHAEPQWSIDPNGVIRRNWI